MILNTLFSAILLPLALPNELFPWGVALPGLVALVPALIAVRMAPDRKTASRLGALFGAVSTALGSYWLAFFGDFSVWTIGGAVLGYTGYNYILFGFLHYLSHNGTPWYRPLRIAILWTGYEYLKSVGFLGYPWGLVAYPLAGWHTVAQTAELLGVWGLSFMAAYVNAALAEVIVNRRFLRHLIAAMALVAVGAGFGTYRIHSIRPDDAMRVLLVQQNVDSWQPGRFSDALSRAQQLTLETLATESGSVGAPDLVVWSETALRRPYTGPDSFYQTTPPDLPFTRFLARLDMPLLTGAPMPAPDSSNDMTNSAILITPDGGLQGNYGKQQLVPFAESIPFWSVPAVQQFFREVVGLYGTWVPGATTTLLEIPLADGRVLPAGAPICFEDAFGWVSREMALQGARVLINLTNNSWSRQDSAQTQHMVAARLRAIELRLPLVRGTNSGFSAVVDATGMTVAAMPMFISDAAVMEVPLYTPQWTLYLAIGDAFGQVAAAGILLWIVLSALKESERQKSER